MPRKRGNQQSKRKVLSLAEFNAEASKAQEVAQEVALPTAPKTNEQWEEEGGRPEFRQGYKQRRKNTDNDWGNMRREPVDGEFIDGKGRPERELEWGSARVGGIEAVGPRQEERDFRSMRREPVEQYYDNRGREPDWGSRRGPVEADPAPREREWNSCRGRGPVEAIAPQQEQHDWQGMRRGPVDARFEASGTQRDWSAARGTRGRNDFSRGRGSRSMRAYEPAVLEEEPQRDWQRVRRGAGEANFGRRGQPRGSRFGARHESAPAARKDFRRPTVHVPNDTEYGQGQDQTDDYEPTVESSEQSAPPPQNSSFRHGPLIDDGTRRTQPREPTAEYDHGDDYETEENTRGPVGKGERVSHYDNFGTGREVDQGSIEGVDGGQYQPSAHHRDTYEHGQGAEQSESGYDNNRNEKGQQMKRIDFQNWIPEEQRKKINVANIPDELLSRKGRPSIKSGRGGRSRFQVLAEMGAPQSSSSEEESSSSEEEVRPLVDNVPHALARAIPYSHDLKRPRSLAGSRSVAKRAGYRSAYKIPRGHRA